MFYVTRLWIFYIEGNMISYGIYIRYIICVIVFVYRSYSSLYIYMYIVYIDCIDNCCNSTAILLIKFHVHRACHLETVKWIRLFMPCWNFEHVVIAFWSGDKYVHSYVSNSKWSSNHYSIFYKILFKMKHSIRICS